MHYRGVLQEVHYNLRVLNLKLEEVDLTWNTFPCIKHQAFKSPTLID